ncbi:ABC transporter permease [Paracoccus sp. MC1862]|uniref:ABC transporter permease n=1 Tax=Paracoccus sp. MC1862 TaxID=2760307 RepID=UPI0015FFED93|nr:ABC transporter permease [Paracoccus sp. MC1862]MBB1498596.1 ABC transporter permease [Paracoccus sp. MC1862]QQO44150.1 ABC transporter permease [Paracoccus sp. MC1862]
MADAAIATPAPGLLTRTRLRMPWLVMLATGWTLLIVLTAIFADGLRPYEITRMDLSARLAPMGTPGQWLGTDELGRDLLLRLIQSVRVSLVIAFGATILSAVFGTTLGFLAAQFRGWVEHLVMALADFQAALPFMIMSLAVLAFFGSSMILLVCLMGFYGWERYARIARGLAISASAQGYAAAVVQLGAKPSRVYLRHILPNVASTLIVSMTLTFPEIILMESGLSFLGLGVQPPESSLGNMVGFGREYLTRAPWIMLAPSAVIVMTTLSISLLGDWLRDRLDPTIR